MNVMGNAEMKKTYPIEIVRNSNVFDNIYFIRFNNSFIDYIDMNCSSLITGYYDISKRQIVNNKCRLDDEGPYEDLDFVIDDYNENLSIDGYELYYLIHKVLEKYDVSEELAYSIAVRLEELRNNTPSDNLINYHKLVFEQKLSRNQLINYYVRNGKFEELKFVLDNPCQTTLVRDRFFMSEAFLFLNNVLGVGIFSSMVETNPTVCRDAIDSYVETVRKGYLFGRERSFIDFDRCSCFFGRICSC